MSFCSHVLFRVKEFFCIFPLSQIKKPAAGAQDQADVPMTKFPLHESFRACSFSSAFVAAKISHNRMVTLAYVALDVNPMLRNTRCANESGDPYHR